tara:strand:+ start:301 stop:537 length:237 start_codon:yes stop_codon:yes gene_type:complete
MTFIILLYKNIYFISINKALLDMTINNPIFIFAIITVIWFIPGIILRRISEAKQEAKRIKKQTEAIEKLYPKKENNSS